MTGVGVPPWLFVEELAFYQEYYWLRLSRAEALRAVAEDHGLTPETVECAVEAYWTGRVNPTPA